MGPGHGPGPWAWAMGPGTWARAHGLGPLKSNANQRRNSGTSYVAYFYGRCHMKILICSIFVHFRPFWIEYGLPGAQEGLQRLPGTRGIESDRVWARTEPWRPDSCLKL